MTPDDARKLMKQMVRDSLRELSDADLQRQAWARGVEGILSDPEELVCQLFDDSGLGDLLEKGVACSPHVDGLFRELDGMLATVDLAQGGRDLTESEAWGAIRAMAMRILRAIEVES
jgi:hypothetical protein